MSRRIVKSVPADFAFSRILARRQRSVVTFVIAFLCTTPLWAQSDSGALLLTANTGIVAARLERLVDDALSHNPSLLAAGKKTTAASAFAVAKKSLDPPQIGVDFYQSPVKYFPNLLRDQMEVDYFIQQMIPFPGKLSAMSGAEKKRADMMDADRQTLADELVRNVKTAFYELYLIDRKREILGESHDLLRNFEEIARKQYEVGMGKQSDILRAQTEVSSIVKDSIQLLQNRISMVAMVNALRNVPSDSAIDPIPEILPAVLEFPVDKIRLLAEANRPELKSMQLAIAMKQAELSSAKKEFYPDFMVRGAYKQMKDAPDDWELMIGLTVPVAPWSLGKYSASVQSANALMSQSNYEYDNMRNMVFSDVGDALSKVRSNQAQVQIMRSTIIPQAQQTLQSTVAAYQTGKQDFLTLIDAQRMLLESKLEYHMAVMNLCAAQAQLERSVGLPVNKIEQSLTGSSK